MRYASPVRWEGQSLLCPYPYRPSKEPSGMVPYDRAQLILEVFLVEMCAVAGLFTEDGVLVGPDGIFYGRQVIEKNSGAMKRPAECAREYAPTKWSGLWRIGHVWVQRPPSTSPAGNALPTAYAAQSIWTETRRRSLW
jgi:hypothetical protein